MDRRSRLAALFLLANAATACMLHESAMAADTRTLAVGYGEADVTPALDPDTPVWLAGYGHGRRASGVHDPLYARALAFDDGQTRIALVSVDVVGLHHATVEKIRERLTEWDYVVVASTHSHEGPDTMGLWGRTPVVSGVDEDYLDLLVERCAAAVTQAGRAMTQVTAEYGTATDDALIEDSRQPLVKDGTIRVVRFRRADDGRDALLWVVWGCHPELLGSRNELLTADFPFATVAELSRRYGCKVAYFSGAVGGLMAPPNRDYRELNGPPEDSGKAFRRAELYGREVADLAARAIDAAEPIELTPLAASTAPVMVPLDNSHFHLARLLGVIRREGTIWTGEFETQGPSDRTAKAGDRLALETEVAYVRMGQLDVACIPGEIYPELVYGRYPEAAVEGVDFPDAELERPIVDILPSERFMLLGLANDEIGYIIPKRQWDTMPPFAYGRDKPQYGEINSCGAEVAPIVWHALEKRVREVERSYD